MRALPLVLAFGILTVTFGLASCDASRPGPVGVPRAEVAPIINDHAERITTLWRELVALKARVDTLEAPPKKKGK